MLDGAVGLLQHDVAVRVVVLGRRAVGDGEVAPRVVAREEDGDVVDGRLAVVGVRRHREPAAARHVDGEVERVAAHGRARLRRVPDGEAGREDLPVVRREVARPVVVGGGEERQQGREGGEGAHLEQGVRGRRKTSVNGGVVK